MAETLDCHPGEAKGDKAAGQASRRHRRRAHDRPCLAPRRRGRMRAGGGGRRRRGHREAVRIAGGEALMTRPDHVSGSDRIFEAVSRIDPEGEIETIVNLQGDLPTLDPLLVRACLAALDDRRGRYRHHRRRDHAGGGAHRPERGEGRRLAARSAGLARALLHQGHRTLRRRAALPSHRHLCVSARGACAFRVLPPSPLETREKLEQLRALEAGMRIHVALVDTVPLGVDTPADLARARQLLTK